MSREVVQYPLLAALETYQHPLAKDQRDLEPSDKKVQIEKSSQYLQINFLVDGHYFLTLYDKLGRVRVLSDTLIQITQSVANTL
jgi:hypothetical protein